MGFHKRDITLGMNTALAQSLLKVLGILPSRASANTCNHAATNYNCKEGKRERKKRYTKTPLDMAIQVISRGALATITKNF